MRRWRLQKDMDEVYGRYQNVLDEMDAMTHTIMIPISEKNLQLQG